MASPRGLNTGTLSLTVLSYWAVDFATPHWFQEVYQRSPKRWVTYTERHEEWTNTVTLDFCFWVTSSSQ